MESDVTISSILANIGSIVTAAFGWVGSAVDAITDSPIILMAVILPFVGLGIGLLKRLLSARA